MAAGRELKRGLLCSGRGWRGASGRSPAPLPLPRGSSSFPPPSPPSPDPSIFRQIGLSLTFRPVLERAKPLSDLIIFHFCLIVRILLLAEKESGSCLGWGREGHPAPRQPRAFGSTFHLLGLWFQTPKSLGGLRQVSQEAALAPSCVSPVVTFTLSPAPVRGRGVWPRPPASPILLLLPCTQFAPGSAFSASILLPSSYVQVAPTSFSSALHAFF